MSGKGALEALGGSFKWGNNFVVSREKSGSLIPWHFKHRSGVVSKGHSCDLFGSNQA